MKVIVFGGTGFIGSHVVEQLHLAGHQVTAAVRHTSNAAFLKKWGVRIRPIDFSNFEDIARAIKGHEVVYNCTASSTPVDTDFEASVEIDLTRKLVNASADHEVARFVQLSTIVLYDFQSNQPMDESYPTKPEYAVQKLALTREKVIEQCCRKNGMTTVILRPASTIGVRDHKSFFKRLFSAHSQDRFPMAGQGEARVSMVDTRDLGRAMVWLGTYPLSDDDNGIYLLKGFDTSWKQFKEEMDRVIGRCARIDSIPVNLSDHQISENGLSPFTVKSFSTNRVWDDRKLRNTGFVPRYSLSDAVEEAVHDLIGRRV